MPVCPSPGFWQKFEPSTSGKGVLAALQPTPLPSTTQLGPWQRKRRQESQGEAGEATGHVIPVLGLDVHLQAIATGGPVPTLLADKQLLSPVLEGFVQAQLCPRQKALGAGRALQGHRRAQG